MFYISRSIFGNILIYYKCISCCSIATVTVIILHYIYNIIVVVFVIIYSVNTGIILYMSCHEKKVQQNSTKHNYIANVNIETISR